jgi:hypothetical protein
VCFVKNDTGRENKQLTAIFRTWIDLRKYLQNGKPQKGMIEGRFLFI